jgi:guanylate kinase
LKEYPEANTLFAFPPSIEELKERLKNRGGYENPE